MSYPSVYPLNRNPTSQLVHHTLPEPNIQPEPNIHQEPSILPIPHTWSLPQNQQFHSDNHCEISHDIGIPKPNPDSSPPPYSSVFQNPIQYDQINYPASI
ncbi:unnamed protein product, partial [Meganyctiphanes norvegica]